MDGEGNSSVSRLSLPERPNAIAPNNAMLVTTRPKGAHRRGDDAGFTGRPSALLDSGDDELHSGIDGVRVRDPVSPGYGLPAQSVLEPDAEQILA